MKNINWNEVPDQIEFKKLVPGCYVAIITGVADVEEKEYLKIEYDIAEGEFINHYQELFDSRKFWGGKFIRSYKETALTMFKGFLTAVKNSNPGFIFNNDENKLVGKLVGVVLGEEEYEKQDRSIGKRLYVHSTRSVEQIKSGEIEIPELKKLQTGSLANSMLGAASAADEFVPF